MLSDPIGPPDPSPHEPKPWIKDLATLQQAMARADNGMLPQTKTKAAIHWNSLPRAIKEFQIEETRQRQGRENQRPRIVLPQEVGEELRVTERLSYRFLDDGYSVARTPTEFRKAIICYLIDCSNAGFLLNVDKIQFGILSLIHI